VKAAQGQGHRGSGSKQPGFIYNHPETTQHPHPRFVRCCAQPQGLGAHSAWRIKTRVHAERTHTGARRR
jgi:hypothetical protein